MTVQYELRVKNRAGTLQAVVVDFLRLEYRLEVNGPGLCLFEIPADHVAVSSLEWDGQIDVRRRDSDQSIDWYVDFYGLYVDEERYADANGDAILRGICVSPVDWLSRSVIAYPAGTSNRTEFTSAKAETIMKTLVTRNATSSGTTGDGRVRDVDGWGANITVQADGAAGNTLDYRCAHRNLLVCLQELALIGGGDFDVVRTAAQTWQFRWYTTQLGTDRSASVVFALQYDNLANPELRRNRYNERTVAIVGGQGEEAARDFVTRTGTNYQTSYAAREVFVDARNYSTTAGYNAAGDTRLEELEARDDLVFDVVQTDARRYGRDYYLGDLVTGYWEGITATKQIASVTVVYAVGTDKMETISLGLADA